MSDLMPVFMEVRSDLAAHGIAHAAHMAVYTADMAVVQVPGSIVGHPVEAVSPGAVERETGNQSGQVGPIATIAGQRIGRGPTEHKAGLPRVAPVASIFVNGHNAGIVA